MVPDMAWHRETFTKPMNIGHVPDWLGLDWYGLGLGPDRTRLDGMLRTITKPTKNTCPHILYGHGWARFTFSTGTAGLTSHVSLARSPLWVSMTLKKTLQNQQEIDIPGECPCQGALPSAALSAGTVGLA